MSDLQMEPPPIRSLPDLTPVDYNPRHPVIGQTCDGDDAKDMTPAFQQLVIADENSSIKNKERLA